MRGLFAAAVLLGVLLPLEGAGMPREEESIKGTWTVTKAVRGGQQMPDSDNAVLEITADTITPKLADRNEKPAKYKLDAGKSPKHIDVTTPEGQTIHGIYEVTKDKLRLCIHRGTDRPKDFDGSGDGVMLIEATRKK